jgi:hypothetical protein
MAMTAADELRITIDDALEQARRLAIVEPSLQISLVIVKLEEALTRAERLETPNLDPSE